MIEISDEILMAYVDGELAGEQADQVRQAIEQDTELARRAAVFTESAAMMRVFDASLDEEVPDSLLATVRSAPAGPWYRRLLARLEQFLPLQTLRPVPALAVVLILILGGWLTYQGLPGAGRHELLPGLAEQKISHVLETMPSGQQVSLDNGRTMELVLTYQDQNGAFCRRFDILRDMRVIGGGIACRTGPDKWQVVASQEENISIPATEGYELAGGEGPLDQFMEQHRKGGILSLQKEQRLLQRKWKRM